MRRTVTAQGVSPASVRRQIRALGAIAHFDPSWGATDNGTTSTWVDCIGGYTVTSLAAASRLIYQTASANLANRPCFRGDGARYLIGASSALADAFDSGSANTVYFVATLVTPGDPSFVFSAGGSATQETVAFGALSNGTANHRRRINAGIDSIGGVFQYASGTPFVQSTVFGSNTVTQWANGGPSQVANATTQNPTNLDTIAIGTAYSYSGAGTVFGNFYGDIGDIVIFPVAHSDATRRYVEQLLAAKYGWPVLKGISGFTAANYAQTANGLGIRGTTGVWADCLVRLNATPSGTAPPANSYETNKGWLIFANAASFVFNGGNGSAVAASPAYAWTAADIGKIQILAGASNGSALFAFRNGVQVGTSTALAGYSAAGASIPNQVGRGLGVAATPFSIFGLGGGEVSQSAANAAARAAAIKAAKRYVMNGGATPSHGWRYEGAAASYADLVGSDAMTRQGTLTDAQIIVTEWPW